MDGEIIANHLAERESITDKDTIKYIKNQVSIGLAGLYSEKAIARKPKKDKPSEYWYYFKKEGAD